MPRQNKAKLPVKFDDFLVRYKEAHNGQRGWYDDCRKKWSQRKSDPNALLIYYESLKEKIAKKKAKFKKMSRMFDCFRPPAKRRRLNNENPEPQSAPKPQRNPVPPASTSPGMVSQTRSSV